MTDQYPEADEAASYLLREASKMDVPDEELDVDWDEYNTDEYLEDHGITAPDTDGEEDDS